LTATPISQAWGWWLGAASGAPSSTGGEEEAAGNADADADADAAADVDAASAIARRACAAVKRVYLRKMV